MVRILLFLSTSITFPFLLSSERTLPNTTRPRDTSPPACLLRGVVDGDGLFVDDIDRDDGSVIAAQAGVDL